MWYGMEPKEGNVVKKTNGAVAVAELAPVSNDAELQVEMGVPYVARVQIEGTAALLFHRYSVESVADKGNAPKNSKAKKTDDIESYVYRDDEGYLCVEGIAMRAALAAAGKSRQDPRSPRKSACDLYKAIIQPLTELARLDPNTKQWDYIDQRRAVVQRNAIPRSRPAMRRGWQATFDIMVEAPQYLDPQSLNALVADAGRFCGLLDYRPTYGRFQVVKFEVITP